MYIHVCQVIIIDQCENAIRIYLLAYAIDTLISEKCRACCNILYSCRYSGALVCAPLVSRSPACDMLVFVSCRFRRRHILLRFCYLGWDYQGLASQEDTARTIEAELFRCLQLTRLVRDRQTANYHRCGRTDKVRRSAGTSVRRQERD